ncbi:pyridoxal phosphate-dependent enzyme, beta subunit [Xylona heveae TC161]|uniref:Pyridoxal phosphate-dependent enzyme, beta subunit n=1 Tax=Xylona heveae (strain CBS 132557 / TC161) TaxID=1328760 RepID=A0A164ZTN0_XYLHT|nr:pyridoxal phosphate-dependent enzyme, beta subunit [Xylona heveae TC161]KZF19498.1 pyridoxal phosphate-dependent enzyme, beta subunit [Xylona heveae TC161]
MPSPPSPVDTSLKLIGNTPVVRLQHVVPEGCAQVYLKMESVNPTGSYKDRMAKSMIEEAEHRGDLKPNMTVIEATGGSTGSSLAFVCAVKGYQFLAISSNAFALEKLRTMEAFGGSLDLVNSPSGKITPDLIPSMVQHAKELAKDDNYYPADQFNNRDALIGYEEIGHELVQQFPHGIDAFCGAVGTAGMTMGVSRVLKSKWPQTHIAVLEPASSPIITEGRTGPHGVEGVGTGFVPPHLDRNSYDEARAVSEEEGRTMCRRLAREEGLLVGTSTGLNVTGAIALAKQLGPDRTVVTVASDTGLKYMNGNLFTNA